MAVGIFDSGLGGLTVFDAAQKRLPDVPFIYMADSAHAPYGVRTSDDIYDLTCQSVQRLFDAGCDLVILACNTASTKALRKIQQEWLPNHYPDRRVLGVVIPLAESAVQWTRYGRIGVIGTRATIESGVYREEILKLSPNVKIFGKA